MMDVRGSNGLVSRRTLEVGASALAGAALPAAAAIAVDRRAARAEQRLADLQLGGDVARRGIQQLEERMHGLRFGASALKSVAVVGGLAGALFVGARSSS